MSKNKSPSAGRASQFPNAQYPLVGDRIFRGVEGIVRKRLSPAGMALVRLGFPADWWLPPELAMRWKTALFPLSPTKESVSQWLHLVQEVARAAFGIGESELAETVRADLQNDQTLIRELASTGAVPNLATASAVRLRIKGKSVLLDAKPVPLDLTPEARDKALMFLRYLVDAKGDWFSGGDMDRAEKEKDDGLQGVRWDVVRKKLPAQLKALIESDRRKGYRFCPTVRK
jgi:hypothetical protein